jgi:hypothetical protein
MISTIFSRKKVVGDSSALPKDHVPAALANKQDFMLCLALFYEGLFMG